MKTLTRISGIVISALLFFGCQKENDQTAQPLVPTLDNLTQSTTNPPPASTPCKGKCCAFTQGYWFAKPNVVWSLRLTIGGRTYTKTEGQAIWDAVKGANNSPLFKAFFQASSIRLSGTPIKTCSYTIYKDISYIESILKTLPKITTANLSALSSSLTTTQKNKLQQAAGRIGAWIDANHCK